jgi:hypothetical protein
MLRPRKLGQYDYSDYSYSSPDYSVDYFSDFSFDPVAIESYPYYFDTGIDLTSIDLSQLSTSYWITPETGEVPVGLEPYETLLAPGEISYAPPVGGGGGVFDITGFIKSILSVAAPIIQSTTSPSAVSTPTLQQQVAKTAQQQAATTSLATQAPSASEIISSLGGSNAILMLGAALLGGYLLFGRK